MGIGVLLLAFILGPMLEQAFRQSLIMSGGKLSIFFTRPISCVAVILALALLLSNLTGALRKARGSVTRIIAEAD